MNEDIDLTKILKDCPKGTKFYSSIYGDLLYSCMYSGSFGPKITFIKPDSISSIDYYPDGKRYSSQGECTLFPSKDQRDWGKFTAPWCKKEKFDPKTLKPFDKVLARDYLHGKWTCGFFSHIVIFDNTYMYNMGEVLYKMCIPYNDDTKHLVGTTDDTPEYYRYWEN